MKEKEDLETKYIDRLKNSEKQISALSKEKDILAQSIENNNENYLEFQKLRVQILELQN